MSKESFYFSHDYGSRNDPKLQKVLMKMGHEGKSVYWDLVEMLYEEGGYLKLSEFENYAFALRTNEDCITKLITEFGLFHKNEDCFWSESILRRLDRRDEKSRKASESAKSRWANANASETNANAMRPEVNRNAIKERKGKDIKEIKEKKEMSDFELVLEKYVEMRKSIKKPATDYALELVQKKLENLSGGDESIKIKILQQSIQNSWQDVFQLKQDTVLGQRPPQKSKFVA